MEQSLGQYLKRCGHSYCGWWTCCCSTPRWALAHWASLGADGPLFRQEGELLPCALLSAIVLTGQCLQHASPSADHGLPGSTAGPALGGEPTEPTPASEMAAAARAAWLCPLQPGTRLHWTLVDAAAGSWSWWQAPLYTATGRVCRLQRSWQPWRVVLQRMVGSSTHLGGQVHYSCKQYLLTDPLASVALCCCMASEPQACVAAAALLTAA